MQLDHPTTTTGSGAPSSEPTGIGRRQFLTRTALAGVGIISLPAVIAACSSPAASPGASVGATSAATAAASVAPSVAPSASTAADFGTPHQGTSLRDFKPFVPNATAGAKPPVPASFAYTVPAASEYFQGLSDAAKQAAEERGIKYDGLVISDGDPVKNIDQMNQLLQRGIGGLWIQPEDSPAQRVVIVKAIEQGVCTSFSGHPATIQGMADQYDLGYQQALGAVQWIKDNLDGKATVMSFILDHIEILIPRRMGTLDALKTGGDGIKILEQELIKINTDEGFEFASTLLQANPDINVWLGPDDTCLGVDAFLLSKGLDPAKEKVLLSGLAGTQAGLDAMASGKSFFRHSYGFNNYLIGYAIGQYMADWFEGKQIPQVLQGRCIPMTKPEDIPAFQALVKDPAASFAKLVAGDYETQGLAAWGQISYDTHLNYTANPIT